MKIKNYNFRVKINEMTIGEFEDCYSIINDKDLLPIEKYIDIITYLIKADGGDISIIDDLTDDELFKIIKGFNKPVNRKELKKEIILDGVKYTSFEDKFIMKARDLAAIERILENEKQFYSYIIAVLFKADNTNHYDKEEIKKRADKIRKLNAADYFQYVIMVSEKIKIKIEGLYDATEKLD
jgi:hypothetical protein